MSSYVFPEKKIVHDEGQLEHMVEHFHQEQKKIVFTNGCFDILHRGHVDYLSKASALGDIFIIGLNSDESVKRRKGESRPINPFSDRAFVLAGLGISDYIVSFAESKPLRLITIIKPNVYVKGGDYHKESLEEARLVESLGGDTHIIPFLTGYSTSRLIERVKKSKY